MAIGGIYHVNINCSNLERSRAFYEMLGFKVQFNLDSYTDPEGNKQICQSLGLPASECKGYMMQLGDKYSCRIDLLCWEPSPGFDPGKPYPHLQCLGYQRIDLWSTDLEADVERIRKFGAEQVGECNTTLMGLPAKIATFKDPDGIFVEITEMTDKSLVEFLFGTV